MSRPLLQIRVTAANRSQDQIWARLDLAHATVNVEFDASDVGSIGRSEEGDGGRHFFRTAEAFEGNGGEDILCELVHLFLGETDTVKDWRFNGTGSDGVDANAARYQFRGKRAGERAQRCFACRVD